ncbi:MAG: hypothetical protein EDR02_13040 [Actinobacteria bacterium]|nr:MAG: hypothetical protein EDR02_13040 [Actinomycetota bacterium]
MTCTAGSRADASPPGVRREARPSRREGRSRARPSRRVARREARPSRREARPSRRVARREARRGGGRGAHG